MLEIFMPVKPLTTFIYFLMLHSAWTEWCRNKFDTISSGDAKKRYGLQPKIFNYYSEEIKYYLQFQKKFPRSKAQQKKHILF